MGELCVVGTAVAVLLDTGWVAGIGNGSGSTEPGLISLPNSSLSGSCDFIAAGCVGVGGRRGSAPEGLLPRLSLRGISPCLGPLGGGLLDLLRPPRMCRRGESDSRSSRSLSLYADRSSQPP